jgi:hypothetical protein
MNTFESQNRPISGESGSTITWTKKKKETTFLLHLRIVWWNNNVECAERESAQMTPLNRFHQLPICIHPNESNVPTRHRSSIIQFYYISIQNVSSDSLVPYWIVYQSVYTMKRWYIFHRKREISILAMKKKQQPLTLPQEATERTKQGKTETNKKQKNTH